MLPRFFFAGVALVLATGVTLAAEKDPEGGPPVKVGRIVSLDLKDGNGSLTALVKRPGRVPLRPTEMAFEVTKETKFLKRDGPDAEKTAVNADQVADTFKKGTSVTIRYSWKSGRLVAKEVSTEGKGGEGAPRAEYRAEQSNKMVIVYAKGNNNTGGWKNELTVVTFDVQPPEFKFTQTRPRGSVTEVITPFSVTATADAPEKIDHVFVTDAAGKHEVPVKQVP